MEQCMKKSVKQLKEELKIKKVKNRSKLTTKEEMCKALLALQKEITYFELLPRDILEETLLRLDYPNIDSYCRSSERINKICSDDKFWQKKIKAEFKKEGTGLVDYLRLLTNKKTNEAGKIYKGESRDPEVLKLLNEINKDHQSVQKLKYEIHKLYNRIDDILAEIDDKKENIINIGYKFEEEAGNYNYLRKEELNNGKFSEFFASGLHLTRSDFEDLDDSFNQSGIYLGEILNEYIPNTDSEIWMVLIHNKDNPKPQYAMLPGNLIEFDESENEFDRNLVDDILIFNLFDDYDRDSFRELIKMLGDGSYGEALRRFGILDPL